MRLMARLGMPVSGTTILRSVKKCAGVQSRRVVVRVAGVDEWAWRKGTAFGTVIWIWSVVRWWPSTASLCKCDVVNMLRPADSTLRRTCY